MSIVQPPETIGQEMTDLAVWLTTLLWRIGVAFQSLTNEFAACIQFIAQPTQATASYEKCGLIIEGENHDPSGNGITKDAVGISAATTIAGGNKTGRAWGGYSQAGGTPDSDGLMIAHELGLDNRCSDQPLLDQGNSKVVISLVAGEGPAAAQKPITAFMVMEPGTGSAHMGSIANRNAFVDPVNAMAFGVRDFDGVVRRGLRADGAFIGGPPFVNSDAQPDVPPGTEMIWGDTKNGITYRLFNNGGAILRMQYQ